MSDAMVPSTLLFVAALFVSLMIALGVVRAAIAYAHRRGMLDQPGQRRSHTTPTPRGGGVGIVLAVLLTMPVCLFYLAPSWPISVIVSIAVSLILVASVGWWDDHRPLSAWPRLGVQLISAALFSGALLATGLSWWWGPLMILAGAWSINLHNFMDGIDGLLAQQGIFVACGLGLLAWSAGQFALAGASGCVATACLGFGYYNRSPARIFMGDVGSGAIGLLLFALTAMLWRADTAFIWPAAILSSSFAVDASLTLASRILNGRRWYTPHREHLYQWIARSTGKHVVGATYFLGWNILVAAPLAVVACKSPRMALSVCIATYLMAAAIWLALKRRLIRRGSTKVRHVLT